MDGLSTVRTEIKSWERSFKLQNGRDPTIQDIKLLPSIADKYKLYKKLSKSAPIPSTSSRATSDPPSTPPKGRPPSCLPHLLLSNARTVETTAPLSTFNPFSPQKNKGKRKQPPITAQSHSNPFGSPVKLKSTPKTQSSVPSQPIAALRAPKPPIPSLPTPSPPALTSAISRARKRLRGEPVSPSPNKDKRRRVGPQSTASFPSLLPEASSSDEEGDEVNLSFVNDSPVKAPATGCKSFKLLFDDSKTRPRQTTDAPLAPTKSVSRGLFGGRSSSVHSEEELEWGFGENGRTKIKSTITTNGKRSTTHIQNLPTHKPATHMVVPSKTLSEKRTSAKRSQPDTDVEYEAGDISNDPPARGLSLLPPSPPRSDSATHHTKQGIKRARANTTTRKKPKITDEQDDEDDDVSDFNNVKIVNRTQPRFKRGQNAAGREDHLDYDSDPMLGRAAPRGYMSQVVEPDAEEGRDHFDVDLPDKLRQVLALESSKTRDSQTESVVKGLLYGRRACNYDPVKGGEIWDVGEDDRRRDGEEDAQRDTEGEDDWEGEPVPWEVGEL